MSRKKPPTRPDGPPLKSLAIAKMGSGYSVITFNIQGNRVVDVNLTEPESRAIAEDKYRVLSAKLQFQTTQEFYQDS